MITGECKQEVERAGGSGGGRNPPKPEKEVRGIRKGAAPLDERRLAPSRLRSRDVGHERRAQCERARKTV